MIQENAVHTKDKIWIKGARVHNLKNIDIEIPRHQFVVVTGLSGSGKSSLTIDTLYAEGQRRYVESLSSYARQFLTRMDKPEVTFIKGISPAIAIEQKVITRTGRSTVGSLTEIYEYLRLLYSQIGKTYSPISGNEVKKHQVSDVVNFILGLKEQEKIEILINIEWPNTEKQAVKMMEMFLQKGFSRIKDGEETSRIEDRLNSPIPQKTSAAPKFLLLDRITVKKKEEDLKKKIEDSVQSAFYEGKNTCVVFVESNQKFFTFDNRFEADGIKFEEPSPHFFNFNSPFGACSTCEGFGSILGLNPDLVIPNPEISVYEGAIAPWRGDKMSEWSDKLIKNAIRFDFPIHRAYKYLTEEEKKLLWDGNEYFEGLTRFFKYVEEKSYKIQYRVLASRYKGKTECPDCLGSRIRKDAQYVKINNYSIAEILSKPINQLKSLFENLEISEYEKKLTKRILSEIQQRVELMLDVGLGYLTLNRLSNSLSGGESQRISLTRSLGSHLTDSLYILDEPSIGLHPRDTKRLIKVLKQLRDLGNTVIVVEHEEEIIKAADYLIDIGPGAGINGGEVCYQGSTNSLPKNSNSLTLKYLQGDLQVPLPSFRRRSQKFINLKGVSHHNLKNIDISIPLCSLTVVSGVSGSGKTTLIKKVFYPALLRQLNILTENSGKHQSIDGNINEIQQVELIDQNPIGKSSRSNPVTYIKAYDAIRELYASQRNAKHIGLKPKHFSFNVEGGRCETCKGEGTIKVEMQFLADITLTCEDCKGKRFKEEILQVKYKDKNIFEVLEMTIDEAIPFFQLRPEIFERLLPLQQVGLNYVKLGQSSSTLSGGEAQRVKLASYLGKGNVSTPVLFIFDEPTTGLHFHDVNTLLKAFQMLIENGHTIVVIEHNLEVIKSADWLIDLGPEGGEEGGYLLFQGLPEDIKNVKNSYTAEYLRNKL